MVTASRRLDRVGRDLDVAVGSVFKTNRCRQARSQFAVHLALGGTCANRAPSDQVANVLRTDGVQKLAACGQAKAVDLNQQLARDAQTFVDAVALVEVRIIDQAFPTHGSAWFLEIHAHHDFQGVGVLIAQRLQAAGVFQRGGRVVDRAWADDDEQTVVLAMHDVVDVFAGLGDQLFHWRTLDGKEANQMFGRG